MLPAKAGTRPVSPQSGTVKPAISYLSAPVQHCDSLHAYDRFSKIEATWSKVGRGDALTAARSCRVGRTNRCEGDEDLSWTLACRAKRSEERPREPKKNPCDRMLAVAFRRRSCARRRRQ